MLSRPDVSPQAVVSEFRGFATPTSNTLYCPNQFFDVCLPHRSRGCVRVVAYLIRRTLGWCDRDGRPLREQHAVAYRELIVRAGVSRDMIRSALAEAERYHFVRCVRPPVPSRAGADAVSGLYELRWDEQGQYVKNPDLFRGFFAGEGNRTYVPNQFFDVVIRSEPLLVAKVVGAVARVTIGFQTKWGHRRQEAPLSLTHIQRYARIGSRSKLVEAIRAAMASCYIVRVKEGHFDADGGRQSTEAVYALRWADGFGSSAGAMVANDRSDIGTGGGRKAEPASRSEKGTGIETTVERKNRLKQQPTVTAAPSNDEERRSACRQLLLDEGFDARAALALSVQPIERVMNQIEWLPLRAASRNRLGLLRRAIEQNWPKPDVQTQPKNFGRPKFRHPNASEIADARQQLAYQLTLKR